MSTKKQVSKVTVDLKNNRLLIVLRGDIHKKELERIYTDVRFCVEDLQPGFDVITDMRDSNIGYLAGAAIFKKIMDFLIFKKVGRVVRIKGKSRIILQQLSRLTKALNGYEPIYVASSEEAEELLQKAQENNL